MGIREHGGIPTHIPPTLSSLYKASMVVFRSLQLEILRVGGGCLDKLLYGLQKAFYASLQYQL